MYGAVRRVVQAPPVAVAWRCFCSSVQVGVKSHTALTTEERRNLLAKRPKVGAGGSVEEYHAIERDIRALHEDVKTSLAHADVGAAMVAASECCRVVASHFGKQHVVFASSLNNMALVYKESGQSTQALNYYQEALAVYEESAGAEHPSTVAVIANIGLLYTRMAEQATGIERQSILDTAHEYVERALELRERILFPGAPLVSVTRTHLGGVLRLQKRLPQARALFETALADLAEYPGKDHRAYGDALNGYGVVLKDQGDFTAAEEAYREALELRRTATHETHPDVLVTEFNLSECLLASGQTQAGLDMQANILARVGVEEDELAAGEYEGAELPGGLSIQNGSLVPAEASTPRVLTPEEQSSAMAAAALGPEGGGAEAVGAAGGESLPSDSASAPPGIRTRSGRVV